MFIDDLKADDVFDSDEDEWDALFQFVDNVDANAVNDAKYTQDQKDLYLRKKKKNSKKKTYTDDASEDIYAEPDDQDINADDDTYAVNINADDVKDDGVEAVDVNDDDVNEIDNGDFKIIFIDNLNDDDVNGDISADDEQEEMVYGGSSMFGDPDEHHEYIY